MAINYFCSGFNHINAFEQFKEHLLTDIKKDNQIAFIPSCKNSYEKAQRWKDIFCEHFSKIGLNFGSKIIISDEMDDDECEKIILSSDVVFLLGGDPRVQIELLKERNMGAPLRNGTAVVMGMSAGAMCMSEFIIIPECGDDYPQNQVLKGLNLCGISVYPGFNFLGANIPNYVESHDGGVKTENLIKLSKEVGEYYLLQDDPSVSMIRCEKNDIKLIGSPHFMVSTKEIVKL